MMNHDASVDRRKYRSSWLMVLLSAALLVLTCLGLLRADALTFMIVIEEEQACRRMLEAGIVNREAAADLIPGFPKADAKSPLGYIAFRRQFFDDGLLVRCRRQYHICMVLIGVAASLVVVAMVTISRVRAAPD